MPAPGQKPETHSRFLDEMLQQMSMPKSTDYQLAHEVAELKREIQSLRRDLTYTPGQIVTGARALAEFERLTRG